MRIDENEVQDGRSEKIGDAVYMKSFKELQKMRERILEGNAHRSDLRGVDGCESIVNVDLGYYGEIAIISVGGKKTIVECDPRDGKIVPMLSDWYDDVSWAGKWHEKWNRDTRFEVDPNRIPAIVKKDGKFAIVGYYGQEAKIGGLYLRVPYNDMWYDSITTDYRSVKFGDTWVLVFDAVKDGKKTMVTNKGAQITIDVNITLEEVKSWTKEDVLHKWIEANRPCTLIHGFAYKGAKPRLIDKEEALGRIKTHSFGIGYYSMEWTVFDGMAVLQFSEYSEGDMT